MQSARELKAMYGMTRTQSETAPTFFPPRKKVVAGRQLPTVNALLKRFVKIV